VRNIIGSMAIIFFISIVFVSSSRSQEKPTDQVEMPSLSLQELETKLFEQLEAHLRGLEDEDMVAVFRDIDPLAAGMQGRRNVWLRAFRNFDLAYNLDEFKLLYGDQELVVARFKCTVVKKREALKFKDNQFEGLQIFRFRENRWMIHEQVLLETAYLKARTPQPRTKQPEQDQTPPDE